MGNAHQNKRGNNVLRLTQIMSGILGLSVGASSGKRYSRQFSDKTESATVLHFGDG